QFRDRFETLISQVLAAEGRAQADGEARQLATACNAIIDGLWMEGGASPVGLEGEDLTELALQNIGLILKLDLIEEGTLR
ncbi:MAG: TetR family transcriptional regulator C-terminal domain-containing protein, partial [Octadecabacter sp.]